MLRGDLGQPPGGWPEALQKKVLKGDEADHGRGPGSLLPPADLEAERAEAEEKLGSASSSEDELASYLMYPKVFADFAARRRNYGPVVGAADAGLSSTA